jgi:nitrate/nitrite-specific signal transduction histidine kinase
MVSRLRTQIKYLKDGPLFVQLRRMRWMVFPGVLLLAALHQLTLYLLTNAFPNSWTWWLQLIIYSLTGSAAAWVGITWISEAVERQSIAENHLRDAYADLEHNHHQLLALHNLGERVAAADDKHALLEIAARAPLEIANARASTVMIFDENQDRLKLDMAWGLSESYLHLLRSRLNEGIPAARCRYCDSLKTHIGSDCPLFEGLQSRAKKDGIQSLICMPVSHEEERIGIISAYFADVDGPPEDHIRLLNILGDVIATALENLRARARESETLHALDHLTNQKPVDEFKALDDIASQVLDITAAGWDAQYGGIYLFNAENSTGKCIAQREILESPGRSAIAQEMVHEVHVRGEPVIRTGLESDKNDGIGSMAAIPLSTEGKTFGALFLGARRQRAIQNNHLQLLRTVAYQIALAIRNAQLYTQLGQMAVLQERHRLSREFHDGLAQTISYLGMQAERVENLIQDEFWNEATTEIHQLRNTIRDAYADVREAIDGLRLSVDNPSQIVDRLSDYCAAFTRQTGIETQFNATPLDLSIDPSTSLQMLRIVQEAMTNIRKHAQAQNVVLLLREDLGVLHLSISDDGVGFPQKSKIDQSPSYGLTTMRERAEGLGGTLTIATSPDEGTRITVEAPVKVIAYD